MFTGIIPTLFALALAVTAPIGSATPETMQLSVVLVDAVLEGGGQRREEPATGFVVGSDKGVVYVLTANHALEDLENGLAASKVTITFARKICPGAIKAEPKPYSNRDYDFAVLSVHLPEQCSANLAGLRRLRISALASASTSGLLLQKRVWIMGRVAEGGIAPVRDIPIRGRTELTILLDTPKVAKQLSGAPLLAEEDGRLVGMVVRGSTTEGEAVSYAVIRADLARAKVPLNYAGEVASLLLRGAPVGSTLTVDDEPPEPVREINELAPGIQRRVKVGNASGYESVTNRIDLLSDVATIRCVTLIKPGDKKFARWRWPLFWTSVGIGVAGMITGVVSWQTHRNFDSNPTESRYNAVHTENVVADVLMGTGVTGLAFFGIGHMVWTPRRESTIGECDP